MKGLGPEELLVGPSAARQSPLSQASFETDFETIFNNELESQGVDIMTQSLATDMPTADAPTIEKIDTSTTPNTDATTTHTADAPTTHTADAPTTSTAATTSTHNTRHAAAAPTPTPTTTAGTSTRPTGEKEDADGASGPCRQPAVRRAGPAETELDGGDGERG